MRLLLDNTLKRRVKYADENFLHLRRRHSNMTKRPSILDVAGCQEIPPQKMSYTTPYLLHAAESFFIS
jgi:hypothetical protein